MSVAFIYSYEQSFWKSCQTITQNLLETYKLVLKNQKVLCFDYNEEMTGFEILEQARKIFDSRPGHIIIVDHKPHVYMIMKFLNHLYQENKSMARPEVILHVFGDFTLYGEQWNKAEPYLKKFKVKFVCASDKQKNLVSKFLKDKTHGLYKLPFPVDSKQFYFSNSLRIEQRKRLKIEPGQIMFLYTGRMSLQKKVIELTIDFIHFLKISGANAVLYLAGEFDDIGSPFVGLYYKNGEFYQKYLEIINNLDPEYLNNVKYFGNLNQEELLGFYNAADFYISLSAHNDEDYGMSPAEAICTGLPAILTDWAGYSSFKLENNGCALIPTKIDEENKRIVYSRVILLKFLIAYAKDISGFQLSREELSKINRDNFSILGNVSNLKNILKDESILFKGFTGYMKELASHFKKNAPPFIFYTTTTTVNFNKLYKKIYESYLSK